MYVNSLKDGITHTHTHTHTHTYIYIYIYIYMYILCIYLFIYYFCTFFRKSFFFWFLFLCFLYFGTFSFHMVYLILELYVITFLGSSYRDLRPCLNSLLHGLRVSHGGHCPHIQLTYPHKPCVEIFLKIEESNARSKLNHGPTCHTHWYCFSNTSSIHPVMIKIATCIIVISVVILINFRSWSIET